MQKLRNSTFRDVLASIRAREYDYGKKVARDAERPDTFYALFYEALDGEGKSPERVIVEGRSELFAEMPDGISWSVCRMAPEDFLRMSVINSGGWNTYAAGFTIPERHDAIFSGKMPNSDGVRRRILDLLNCAAETFQMGKYPVLITRSSEGPWTVLEGNHTMLALYHAWKEMGQLFRDTVLVGVLPRNAQYRFLRDGMPLNTAHTKQHKTAEDIAAFDFPDFVKKALS